MEIKFLHKTCIITPLTSMLDKHESMRIMEEIKKIKNAKFGLNLQYVDDCTIDFFDVIKNINNIGIYNINANVFTLLNIMNFDKYINLYTTEDDFVNNTFRLVNRKLKIA